MAKKYSKIYHLGHKENFGIIAGNPALIITEKFDGSNARFWLEDGTIMFGSHNVELGYAGQIPKKHMHRAFAQYILSKVKPEDLDPDYTYFGEMMSMKHTLEYNDHCPPFIGFDIWVEAKAPGWEQDKEGTITHGRFMEWTAARSIFDKLGLARTNPIYEGRDHWSADQLKALIGESAYGLEMEGIVIKSYGVVNRYGRQIFAKIVREEFQEKNKAAFGEVKTVGPESAIVSAIYTRQRIAKKAHQLMEAGEELDLTMMKFLPKMVFDDGIEEEWREIVYIRKPIDFSLVRKLIAKKCVKTLRQMMMEQVNDQT